MVAEGAPHAIDRETDADALAWAVLLTVTPGLKVLEVSADDGARAAALTAAGAEVTLVRPGRDGDDDEDRHDAAVIDAHLGGGDRDPTLDALLGQLAPRIEPGGSLLLTIRNPLFAAPGMAALAPRLGLSGGSPAFALRGPAILRQSALRGAVTAAGFGAARVFAPLPTAERPKFIVPLGARPVVDYFFRNLAPRPHTPLRRAALEIARRAAGLGMFDLMTPTLQVSAVRARSA